MTTTTENLYVGDGSTVLYAFTFPYINEADVKVSLNQLDITEFTLANATTVELNTAPANGVSIRIYRETPTDSLYAEFYPGSAIRAQDLNGNFEQTLYVVQESQAIIENSDAASVVGIANEALATANQAKNTADSVSGTANQALTEASGADTTANQALSDAATAQATAVAARTVADAALNSGSVLSDLSDVSSTPATTNQVLGWSGSTWGPVNQTGGGGGGGTTINYNGASAWATFTSGGSVAEALNASVVSVTTGEYAVTFTTPMPNANYAVTTGGLAPNVQITGQTANGFTYNTSQADGAASNYGGSFAVFATNALPPTGGTGTDAWCTSIGDGFNIASVTQSSGNGNVWSVVFTTPMPSDDYAVVATPVTSSSGTCFIRNRISTGFDVVTRDYDGSNLALGWTAVVHATNATLPTTLTTEGALNPTGSVTMFAGTIVPLGWLECNGQAAPTALAAVLGQANVPDLRGEFVRGWDNGRGVDAGRNLLTTQADEFKAHNHPGSSVAKVTGGISVAPGSSNSFGGGTIANDGGVETRPRNVSLMYIIKT